MGKKFYAETENGGTAFYTERRIGDVRVPNYVYDIWLPVLGAQALGVYAVYCRLERQGAVKAMTQSKLARACRMGTGKLSTINDQLQNCGFVRIKKPKGAARLMHWTTEITVLDAPQEVSKEIKDEYAPPSGYEVLTPWLEADSPENLPGFSEEPAQDAPETPDQDSKVAPLGSCKPLDVEKESSPENSESERKPDLLDAMVQFQSVSEEDNWATPAAAGGADDWAVAVDAFAALKGISPATVPDSTRREWSKVLREIGREWSAGPRGLAEVVEAVPRSEFHWKAYSSPHQARDDLGILIGQQRDGGIKPPRKANGGNAQQSLVSQIREYRERKLAEQPAVVDAEWRVVNVGESL